MTRCTGAGGIQTTTQALHHHRAYQPHRSSLLHTSSSRHLDAKQQQQEKQLQQQSHRRDDTEVVYDDDDDDFMMRIVHGSCQGFHGDGGSLCQFPTCQLPDQLDVLLHCRQPLSFLSFFHQPHHRNGNHDDDHSDAPALLAGAYMMPTGCEYCGADETAQCDASTCRRPNFYFQKKRPPFSKADSKCWDVETDHYIPPPPPIPIPLPMPPPRSPSSPFEGNWVSGLFRKGNNNRVDSPTPR